MKKLTYKSLVFALAVVLVACGKQKPQPPALQYEGTEPRVQLPLKPEESQLHVQLPEGFEAELFAAEPDIINPIAFSWDERGRLWVVQSMDYPHNLENDVGGDRITICEDTDGDGRADKFTDFATEQSLSTGIVVVNGGVIVAQAPDMVFLQDTDGDDKMDKRQVLFGGFGTWDTHAGPSSLKYGHDNTIWGAVGYSGFSNSFGGKKVDFKMGVYRFTVDGKYFEPVGRFNNNTWGMGVTEDFEIFGSTANNNHSCYVGIPLRYYDYLDKRPSWAVNADFIQGHYEITPATEVPLQQVDVRGGYTAAAGANFYTARNYPKEYWNQMLVTEPTGHLVHLARIEENGAGYKEVDGGNIFASTDAWTAPVFAETGPDGNIWVADWYNPVIQHNPDKRGMENQIWNADKGEGNAHINPRRDKLHGRIYIIKHEDGDDPEIESLEGATDEELLEALRSDNLFWRITAQRLIIGADKKNLVNKLIAMATDDSEIDESGLNAGAQHALWTLDGLGVLDGSNAAASEAVVAALSSKSPAVQRAAITLLPQTTAGSDALANAGLIQAENLHIRLAALLKAGELPETNALYEAVEQAAQDATNQSDKWLTAALKVYYKEKNYETVDPATVRMIIPSAEEAKVVWKYSEEKPADDWMKPGFDDASWKKGQSLFGGSDEERVKTKWETRDIWLRREVTLNEAGFDPVLKIAHDDDYEVYVNGQLLFSESGASRAYKYINLDAELSEYFVKGKNVIAVYCHDGGGDRHIDVGIGKKGKPKADARLVLNTVSQKMAFDKKLLYAKAGQTIELVLNNKDEMPHNVVVIQPGTLDAFGEMVDSFLKKPGAAEAGYVPNSRYVLGVVDMLDPAESASVIIQLPDEPGRYPFVCTFPGHWRMMQGEIIVTAPGNYISDDPEAPQLTITGGGGSHDFLKQYGVNDGRLLSMNGEVTVRYTENTSNLGAMLSDTDVLLISNNKPFDVASQQAIFKRVNEGMRLMINHPGAWYNWKDWPKYNKELVGGGSTSHEKYQEFEVIVNKPDHPIMKGVPARFRITDELYRFKADKQATPIEVLATGRGLESGEEFPVVWIVKHDKTRIVCNTLGHDDKAHQLPAYKTLLLNSFKWVKE